MREQPKGDALLACARQVLREEILPTLAADRKHALLMVMNALSIAERQLQYGDGPEAEELAALRNLLDDSRVDAAEGAHRLSRLLREGKGDPGQPAREALFGHLRRVGLQRLRESNPKALPK